MLVLFKFAQNHRYINTTHTHVHIYIREHMCTYKLLVYLTEYALRDLGFNFVL